VRVYVGNLPFNTSGEELRSLFDEFGQVDSATIVTDRETGRSRGFGFVEMSNDDDARRAIEQLNSADMGGRTLVVNEARPREQRGGGGGGGGGGRRGGGGGGGRRERW
jgi:cold-inducible RNA-binding protein